MDKEKIKNQIRLDEDFIYSPKFHNSLSEFVQKHTDGVDDSHAAKVLLLSEEELQEQFQEAVVSLRKNMDVDKD